MRVLNVGGGSNRDLPPAYKDYVQDILDIDPVVHPDILCDAREMLGLPAGTYDAVFCSHTLEHFYKHDVPKVLAGFRHVLKADGVAHISVPNIPNAFLAMRANNLDLHDIWYRTGSNTPITFHDVLYGWNHAMERGNLFYAHKCGFSGISLGEAVMKAGFPHVRVAEDQYNIVAKASQVEQSCQLP